MKDWNFKIDKSICNFRSAGILIQNGKLLVQRDKGGNIYALSGGQVKIGESSVDTLIREYKEETGADIICKRLIWIEECFWEWNNIKTNTIAFYYLIELSNDGDIPEHDEFVSQKDNCSVVLGWIPLEKLLEITVYPSFLKEKISDIKPYPEHFITNE